MSTASTGPSSRKKVLLKLVLLGEAGVGKTSLHTTYHRRVFTSQYSATIGADFLSKIWDTAGQERFESLGSAFYRGADGLILVYDVTEMRTLKALQKRLDTFFVQSGVSMDRDAAGFYKYPIVVFGNKTDLSGQRQVSAKEAGQVLNQMGLRHHCETNAKDYATVEAAFYQIAQLAAEQAARRPVLPPVPPAGLHEPDHVHTECCAIL